MKPAASILRLDRMAAELIPPTKVRYVMLMNPIGTKLQSIILCTPRILKYLH